jgi:glycerol kinase
MADHVAAIDQGTTSSRCIVFDRDGDIKAVEQREHEQINPRAGWVEHDPQEVIENVRACLEVAEDVAAIGITNQRETTVVWDKESGEPVHNAIVWQDTRTDAIVRELGDPDQLREATGLPLSTYFSGPKVKWILDNVDGARERAEAGDLLFGTMDTWVLWNLTGEHATDVTNASRTLLMDLETLQWREDHCELLGIPTAMLPEIRSSSEPYGEWNGVPVAGILGDQQAALFGQTAFDAGDAKNTYGTGSFLLVNTGDEVKRTDGLLTTVGFQCGDEPATYALEGSIAVTGALVQWLRDRLKIIDSADEIEALARTVDDNGGVYFVPAFSGLFAPYWRDDARGAILGLTAYNDRGHIARAALEAAAWQTKEVVEAAKMPLTELRVDGGMTVNDLLMQFQADVLGVPVVRPKVTETTALGAAYAAGLATGVWESRDELRERWSEGARWEPGEPRDEEYATWRKAVQRTLDWVDD